MPAHLLHNCRGLPAACPPASALHTAWLRRLPFSVLILVAGKIGTMQSMGAGRAAPHQQATLWERRRLVLCRESSCCITLPWLLGSGALVLHAGSFPLCINLGVRPRVVKR